MNKVRLRYDLNISKNIANCLDCYIIQSIPVKHVAVTSILLLNIPYIFILII